jgi:hypothetical protein
MWTLTYREICRKAHHMPNPAPAPAAMRTTFGRLSPVSINFRYFFGPNFQRRTCRLGNNAPITPSPIIVIAAICLSLLPTIKSSLSFIEIDLSQLILAGLRMVPACHFRFTTKIRATPISAQAPIAAAFRSAGRRILAKLK